MILFVFEGSVAEPAYPQARGYNFINLDKTPQEEVKGNWDMLLLQNVSKANYICNEKNEIPKNKEDISQNKLFSAMKQKYVDVNETVAILNSFPIFIFEYVK